KPVKPAPAKQSKPATAKQPKPEPVKENTTLATPSPTDAETGVDTDKTNSEGDTEILNIGGEQGEDVA
ncbi:hypothetical protein Tco_0665714, partial [Tanacetum coccineum]